MILDSDVQISAWPALLAVIVIGLVNGTLGLFLKLITFPLTILTLGILWFVINALMLMAASALVPGFKIQGFFPAFLGAIVLSIVNLIMHWLLRMLTAAPSNNVF